MSKVQELKDFITKHVHKGEAKVEYHQALHKEELIKKWLKRDITNDFVDDLKVVLQDEIEIQTIEKTDEIKKGKQRFYCTSKAVLLLMNQTDLKQLYSLINSLDENEKEMVDGNQEI